MVFNRHVFIQSIEDAVGECNLPMCFRIFEQSLNLITEMPEKAEIKNSLSIIKGNYTLATRENMAGRMTFDEYGRKIAQLFPGIFNLANELSLLFNKITEQPNIRKATPPDDYKGIDLPILSFEIRASNTPLFINKNFSKFLDSWEAKSKKYPKKMFDYDPSTGEEIEIEYLENICWATGILICEQVENGKFAEAEVKLDIERSKISIKINGDEVLAGTLMNQIRNWWKQQRN